MMEMHFMDGAIEDLTHWMRRDPKICKKIGELLTDIQRNGHEGKGKPEPLKYGLQGWWSRRITDEHRLVYRIEDGVLYVSQCRFHYGD